MGLRINQNIAALNASRNLRNTDNAMSKSLERLSSGFRINSAADDPAGLIISENLRAQIDGLGQAVKNSSAAVNVVRTAEAALDETLKQLRAIRTLALDALNTGSSDKTARAADQTQIESSIATINRIGANTQFGKIKLLNGSSGVRGSSNSNDLEFIAGSTKTVAGTFDTNIATIATKGTKTFAIANEFETADAGGAAIALTAGNAVSFQVDFGTGLGTADTKALGVQLTAAGLKNDITQTGVKVRFDAENAIAYVAVDRTAADADNVVDASLLENMNGTTLGKIVNFSKATGVEEIRVTGRFAGQGFKIDDNNIDGRSAGFSTQTGAVVAAAAVLNFGDAADSEGAAFDIDFGVGLSTAAKAILGESLAEGGLVNSSETFNTNSTLTVTLNKTTAVVTVTAAELTTSDIAAATAGQTVAAALQASTSNISDFVTFGSAAANTTIDLLSARAITVNNNATAAAAAGVGAAVTSGFTGQTLTGVGGQTAAVVATLGAGTGLAIADIKVIGETLTINDSTIVKIAAGTALTSVISRINSAIEADEIKVKASFKADTANSDQNQLIFSNTEFGDDLTTVKSTNANTLSQYLGIGTSLQNVQGKDLAGTINGVKATGDGQFMTLDSTGDKANGVKVKYTSTSTTLPTDGTLKTTVTQNSLLFQVGANSGQTVKQSIEDVRSNNLGKLATGLLTSAKTVADINVLTSDGANDALRLVDDAINTITTIRGNLGAFQANVLESNINSLGVAKENLSAAESAIRDADFADETVEFTRNQILLQAGTAILTQANAIPQAVLQLLQS
jgi:flagellin